MTPVDLEHLYHVTDEDIVTGGIERGKAHSDGLLHRSGIVFLFRSDGKVLLQHRSPTKKIFPDCYECSSAFHVIFGESYDQAAMRELLEETGVSASLRFLGKFTHHDPPEHQVVACYLAECDTPVKLDSSEAAGGDFYSPRQVDEIIISGNVTPWLRDGWKLTKGRGYSV